MYRQAARPAIARSPFDVSPQRERDRLSSHECLTVHVFFQFVEMAEGIVTCLTVT
jgi:hypothetical protein